MTVPGAPEKMGICVETQTRYRVSSRIYRNNLVAAGLSLGMILLIGLASAYSFGHPLLIGSAVLALVAAILGYLSRWLRHLVRVIVLDTGGIACVSRSGTLRLEWQEIGAVRGAFNASDIVICDCASKPAFTIFGFTEGFQELVNSVLQHVAPEAIGTGSSTHGIEIQEGCVVLDLKEPRRIALEEVTGLRVEYDSRPSSALAKLVIECAGSQVSAVNISNYIIEGYGLVRRALQGEHRRRM